jgi:acyl-CoA synthetase (NDP forming)
MTPARRIPPYRGPHPAVAAFVALAARRRWRVTASGSDFASAALGKGMSLTLDLGQRASRAGGRRAILTLTAQLGSAAELTTPPTLANAALDRLADATFALHRAREAAGP